MKNIKSFSLYIILIIYSFFPLIHSKICNNKLGDGGKSSCQQGIYNFTSISCETSQPLEKCAIFEHLNYFIDFEKRNNQGSQKQLLERALNNFCVYTEDNKCTKKNAMEISMQIDNDCNQSIDNYIVKNEKDYNETADNIANLASFNFIMFYLSVPLKDLYCSKNSKGEYCAIELILQQDDIYSATIDTSDLPPLCLDYLDFPKRETSPPSGAPETSKGSPESGKAPTEVPREPPPPPPPPAPAAPPDGGAPAPGAPPDGGKAPSPPDGGKAPPKRRSLDFSKDSVKGGIPSPPHNAHNVPRQAPAPGPGPGPGPGPEPAPEPAPAPAPEPPKRGAPGKSPGKTPGPPPPPPPPPPPGNCPAPPKNPSNIDNIMSSKNPFLFPGQCTECYEKALREFFKFINKNPMLYSTRLDKLLPWIYYAQSTLNVICGGIIPESEIDDRKSEYEKLKAKKESFAYKIIINEGINYIVIIFLTVFIEFYF